MPGPEGTPSGDLYVDVDVAADDHFEREGAELILKQELSFAEAALGAKFDVVLPNEEEVVVKVPPGSQPGTILTVPGYGVPRLGRRGRGDLHVVLSVYVPQKLSRKAKKLLEELGDELMPPE
jgi:molecular chaperone DnaJ